MISVIIIRFIIIGRVCGLKTGMNIAKNKKPRCNGVLMSERRGSNSRHPPWQGGALPAELLSHEIGAQNYSYKAHLSIGFWQEFKLSFLTV